MYSDLYFIYEVWLSDFLWIGLYFEKKAFRSRTRIPDTANSTSAVIIQLRYHFEGSIEIKMMEIIQRTSCMGVPILMKSAVL